MAPTRPKSATPIRSRMLKMICMMVKKATMAFVDLSSFLAESSSVLIFGLLLIQ